MGEAVSTPGLETRADCLYKQQVTYPLVISRLQGKQTVSCDKRWVSQPVWNQAGRQTPPQRARVCEGLNKTGLQRDSQLMQDDGLQTNR